MDNSLTPNARIIAPPAALTVAGVGVAVAGTLLVGSAFLIPLIVGIAAAALGSTRLAYAYATFLSLERRIIQTLDQMKGADTDGTKNYVIDGHLNLAEALRIAKEHPTLERRALRRQIDKALLQMGKCLEIATESPESSSDSSSRSSTPRRPLEAWDIAHSSITLDLD